MNFFLTLNSRVNSIFKGTVLIDFHTVKDLELVRNAVNNKQIGSLMGKYFRPMDHSTA